MSGIHGASACSLSSELLLYSFPVLVWLLLGRWRSPVASSSSSVHPLLATCAATGPRPGLPWGLSGKESAASAGDAGSTPESGSFPGELNDSALQYPCLGNPMGGGACLRNLATEPPPPGPQPQLCSGSKPRQMCFMKTRTKAEPVWERCPRDF